MLKEIFPPEHPWFECFQVLVDLGFQGIRSDYKGNGIEHPVKKPRKSKNNPAPQLTDAQKVYNQSLSQVRVLVENAIAGLKRYNILFHAFRNRKQNFHDSVIDACAGLWNFSLNLI
jgi:hypothetical protein